MENDVAYLPPGSFRNGKKLEPPLTFDLFVGFFCWACDGVLRFFDFALEAMLKPSTSVMVEVVVVEALCWPILVDNAVESQCKRRDRRGL
tara:strand:+ start:15905 stop:16174 length:270 start_codon:yes stop_codon:yes gene_type:complete